MTDPKKQITEGNNPKDLRSKYAHVIKELNMIYPSTRRETMDIPKELLKSELIFFFVEGYNDKKIGELFVQKTKTIVHAPRIPKKKNSRDDYSGGRDAVTWILDRKNLENFSYEPVVKKIRNNRVIGLIDRDFEQLSLDNSHQNCLNLYQCSCYKNLFATETNDIDTFFLCYGGLSIFIKRFSKNFAKEGGNFALIRMILDQAELLGDAFRAAKKTGVKFTHIDSLSLNKFCKILRNSNPDEMIREFINLDEKNRTKDTSIIKEFFTLFHHLREERKNKKCKSCHPDICKDDPISVDDLSGCRGHTLMEILCCFSSYDVKMDFIPNPLNDAEKPDNILFNKIFREFRNNNSLCQSTLYLSLRTWEQKNHLDFLKKC
jgi:hypothetical protein